MNLKSKTKFEVISDVESVLSLATTSLKNGWYSRRIEASEEVTDILFRINSETYKSLNDYERGMFRAEIFKISKFLGEYHIRRKGRGGWYLSVEPKIK